MTAKPLDVVRRGDAAPSRAAELTRLEHELGVLLRRVKRVIGERARSVHPELQPASYLMLGYLESSGPVRASGLVERFGVDKGAISRQVGHLESLGLLERHPDPDDGRAWLVSVTADARRRMATVDDDRRRWVDERLGDWTAPELQTLVDGLARYNAALD